MSPVVRDPQAVSPAIAEEALSYAGIGKARAGHFWVPQDAAERDRLTRLAEDYVSRRALVPPLVMAELEEHADAIIAGAGVDRRAREFLFILINNAAWRPVVAAIPYERRTLMLPPCLRDSAHCKAAFDKLGLLCERCGRCDICALSEAAEDLGYTVLVAEGTTIVASLVQRGEVDAVIGVSCMAALERTFPHMVAGAVPGLAVPLLTDGCQDTRVANDWVLQSVRLRSNGHAPRCLNLNALHREVSGWFTVENLRSAIGAGDSPTERISLEWLAKSGKRWRPFLTVAVHQALSGCVPDAIPDAVRKAAVAVECIHKASLIYDDIQDGDDQRYGEPTVHRVHGVPVAMTASLFLLGHGYRLLSDGDAPDRSKAEMLRLATEGHCRLCLGQGSELWWMRNPAPLSVAQVLDIFAYKTAPSFEVVFRLGAICAGADPSVHEVLKAYSEAVGVAYQIQDDLSDFTGGGDVDDIRMRRPSIVLALAYETADPAEKEVVGAIWGHDVDAARADAIRGIIARHEIERKARDVLDAYRQKALRSLIPLRSGDLKMVLCRLLGQIFTAAPRQPAGSP